MEAAVTSADVQRPGFHAGMSLTRCSAETGRRVGVADPDRRTYRAMDAFSAPVSGDAARRGKR